MSWFWPATRPPRTRCLLLGILASWALAGCDLEITVCELPESLNTCGGDGDCFLVYCGVECCPCERVASARQFEETYCMVRASAGHTAAREECQEARDTNCEGVSCTGVNACPHPVDAVCEDGRCVAAY